MRPISQTDLKVGMIVVMTKAGDDFPGLRNRIFKVISLDDPYIVLRTTDAVATTHMIIAAHAEFAVPSDETVESIAPDESWPSDVS
jgi:hypothetical protein